MPDAAGVPGALGELLERPASSSACLFRSGRLHARELVEADAISPSDPRPFAGVPIAIKAQDAAY